jgi:hypothetical protein
LPNSTPATRDLTSTILQEEITSGAAITTAVVALAWVGYIIIND